MSDDLTDQEMIDWLRKDQDVRVCMTHGVNMCHVKPSPRELSAAERIEALRAENTRLRDCYKGSTYTVDVLIKDNARLREAGKEVVEWWLRDGMNKFDGAPGAMFNLRAALGETE